MDAQSLLSSKQKKYTNQNPEEEDEMTQFLSSLKKEQGEEDPVKWEKIDFNTIDVEETLPIEEEEGAPPSKEASSTSAKKSKNTEEMFIVTLPVPVPYVVCAASNLLFIRQDDIGLFRELRKLQRTLLIGNAGIGKSWFQWIHILFCARPDIYKAISEDDDFPPDRNENKEPPQIILRYTPTKLNVFFPSLGVVHLIPSSAPNYPSLLMEMFDEPRVTLLYDPEVELRSLKIPSLRELNFLVSLSPSVQRFETWKTKIYGGDVLMRYMPCPSLKELIVTVRSIHGMSNSGLVGDELKRRNDVDELVKSRVSQIGPFLREVIQRDEVWNKTLKDRLKMFGKLDLSMLGETVPDHPENHFIHIYAVDREDLPYSKFTLKLSCDLVVEEAKKALAKLGC